MGVIAGAIEEVTDGIDQVSNWINNMEAAIVRQILDPIFGSFEWAGHAAVVVEQQIVPYMAQQLGSAIEAMSSYLGALQAALEILGGLLKVVGAVVGAVEDAVDAVGDFLTSW